MSLVGNNQIRKVDLNWTCFSVHTRTERYDTVPFQFLICFSLPPNFWTCFGNVRLIFPYPCERNPSPYHFLELNGAEQNGTISFPCERGLCHLSIWLGSIHTRTISYRSVPLRFKKWYREGLHSHWYGKNQPDCFKAGPEIGWYRKVNQKLEQYDIVLVRTEKHSSAGPLSGPVWFLWATPSWFL